jgi:hypothetical protein
VRELAVAPDEFNIRRALVARLVYEFRPELNHLGLTQQEIDQALKGAEDRPLGVLAAGVRVWGVEQDGEQTDILAPRGTLIGSRMAKLPMAVVTLSDQRKEFRADPGKYPLVQNAFVKGTWHSWDWLVGQEYESWGPDYSGSLILSDNAPAWPLVRIDRDFSLGRYIGRFKLFQSFGTFEDGGQRFFFGARRGEKTLSDQWSVAVNETAKIGETPNPLIFVLPSFYLYQRLFLETDPEFNSFLSFDVTYRFMKKSEGYLEFLIDDMTTPKSLGTQDADRPRRIGWMLGFYHPFTPDTTFRAEYVFTDRETYLSARPQYPRLSYTHDGEFIGSPVGPNSMALFLRGEQRLSPNLDLVVEYFGRKSRFSDGPNPGSETSYDAFLSYGLRSDAALWLRAQRFLNPAAEGRLMLGGSFTF